MSDKRRSRTKNPQSWSDTKSFTRVRVNKQDHTGKKNGARTTRKRTSRSFDDSSALSDLEDGVREEDHMESLGGVSGISYKFSGGIGSGAGGSFLK